MDERILWSRYCVHQTTLCVGLQTEKNQQLLRSCIAFDCSGVRSKGSTPPPCAAAKAAFSFSNSPFSSFNRAVHFGYAANVSVTYFSLFVFEVSWKSLEGVVEVSLKKLVFG